MNIHTSYISNQLPCEALPIITIISWDIVLGLNILRKGQTEEVLGGEGERGYLWIEQHKIQLPC